MNFAPARRMIQRRQNGPAIEYLEGRLLLAFTNGAFESGLSGFTVQEPFTGAVTTATTFQGRSAAQGSSFALLSTGMDVATSSITQTFHAEAGDVLTGQAFFFANDTRKSTDAGSVQVLDANGNVVTTLFSANAQTTSSVFTPWTNFTHTFTTAGDFTLKALAFNGEECSNAAYLGLDALNLTSNGTGNPTPGTITIGADTYTTAQDTPLSISAPGVLGNDVASNGSTLSAAVATGPAHGTLVLNTNGSFTYTPASGFSGSDAFTYTASGTDLTSATGTVTLTITPVGNPTPGTITVANDVYAVPHNTPLTIAAPGVLGNDTASNSATLTAAVATGPAHGTLTLNSNGSFTYTPTTGFSGADTFTYTASGTGLTPATGTVTLNVAAATTSGTITVGADAYRTGQDTPLSVGTPGVLGNDTASNSATLTATLATGPAHGTLTLNPNGSFSYTPTTGFSGTDTFTYTASGTGLTSATGTATITVTATNPNPPPTTTPGNGITYDLRFADGSKSTVITAPGTYTVDLWAMVHDPNPPFTDEGLSYGLVNVVSQQINGGAIGSGGVTSGATTAAFTRPAESHNGAAANISNDGIADWGTDQTLTFSGFPAGTMRFISANTTDTGVKAQLAGTAVPGESDQFNSNTWEWRVARFTITVSSVGTAGGETDFLPQFPNAESNAQFLLAGFFQDQPGLTDPNAPVAAVNSQPLSIGAPLRFVFGTTPIG
jgi:hypothetical protein